MVETKTEYARPRLETFVREQDQDRIGKTKTNTKTITVLVLVLLCSSVSSLMASFTHAEAIPRIFHGVRESINRRCHLCIEANGQHFEQLL